MVRAGKVNSISNYYGTPFFFSKDGNYYLALDDWNGTRTQQITEYLYNALVGEFGYMSDKDMKYCDFSTGEAKELTLNTNVGV